MCSKAKAPLLLLALSRNEGLLQYIGCRPEVGYLLWHGSFWISYMLVAKHPEEHVLSLLKTTAPSFPAQWALRR